MDTKIWHKTYFTKDFIPDWNCPNCKNDLLKLVSDKFCYEETESSKSFRKEEAWEPEFIRYIFHGLLKCSACNDNVVFIGKGEFEYLNYYDEYRDEHIKEKNDVFTPIYFYPSLQIFNITDECPNDIKNEIIESFGLFWSDLPSCANKIRSSLEMIMNQQKVKKHIIVKRERRFLSLHKRIEAFKLIKPNIAEYLLAIKWIGNFGSHAGKLERIDLLDAFELLEHSINKLYDDKEDKLIKISKEINKRKGTRKKKIKLKSKKQKKR